VIFRNGSWGGRSYNEGRRGEGAGTIYTTAENYSSSSSSSGGGGGGNAIHFNDIACMTCLEENGMSVFNFYIAAFENHIAATDNTLNLSNRPVGGFPPSISSELRRTTSIIKLPTAVQN
jgi:hypothetical protein